MSDLLDSVLDTLIPPSEDGRMPGAGGLGLSGRVREAAPDEVLSPGLDALAAAGFRELDLADRVETLRALEAEQPAFVPTVYTTLCTSYYLHPDVQTALGLEPRPPFPKGYELDPGDLDALERVRARGPIYRTVDG